MNESKIITYQDDDATMRMDLNEIEKIIEKTPQKRAEKMVKKIFNPFTAPKCPVCQNIMTILEVERTGYIDQMIGKLIIDEEAVWECSNIMHIEKFTKKRRFIEE